MKQPNNKKSLQSPSTPASKLSVDSSGSRSTTNNSSGGKRNTWMILLLSGFVCLCGVLIFYTQKTLTPSTSSTTSNSTGNTTSFPIPDIYLATANESLTSPTWVPVPCIDEYKPSIVGCTPASKDKCGRLISDTLCSREEAARLQQFAQRIMTLGGGTGGPTILDLHSGALSKKDKFISVYATLDSWSQEKKDHYFPQADLDLYISVKNKIQSLIAAQFGLDKLYLTSPTFFSKIEAHKVPKTINDEYWHVHVDRTTYGSFVYTSLLYLSDFGEDFEGGEFAFVAQKNGEPLLETHSVDNDDHHLFKLDNSTLFYVVQPRLGRVSLFTSGPENPHYVRKVTKGTRYALTVAFTCDKRAAIKDPSL